MKRYPEDEGREALRLHMARPESKQILSQRKSLVEPVFSALRGIQRLERFRRKGLSAVKLEFSLHAMAYNLSRAVALILGIIFSLLSIQITGCPKSVIEFNLMLEKVTLTFCDTLFRGCRKRRVLSVKICVLLLSADLL
ncbi:transposase [Photorhabdus akhurstii]|nr:transposase [Photorhabdus akhurstii]